MEEIKLSSKKKEAILKNVELLLQLYCNGELGGEIMPEDANPGLGNETKENYLYFTLPMALNYQRNSYMLWEAVVAFQSNKHVEIRLEDRQYITVAPDTHVIQASERLGQLHTMN